MRRVEVRLDDKAYERVTRSAARKGIALAEAVREALGRYCEEVEREDRVRAAEELGRLEEPVPSDPRALKREILEATERAHSCGAPEGRPSKRARGRRRGRTRARREGG